MLSPGYPKALGDDLEVEFSVLVTSRLNETQFAPAEQVEKLLREGNAIPQIASAIGHEVEAITVRVTLETTKASITDNNSDLLLPIATASAGTVLLLIVVLFASIIRYNVHVDVHINVFRWICSVGLIKCVVSTQT